MASFDHSRYEAEVKEKWGETGAYREHAQKTKGYTKDMWERVSSGMEAVFGKFAACRAGGAAADSPEAQAVAAELQAFITANFYTCTKPVLAGLGQMYVCDERFRANIDRHGEGTADYASEAIRAYCG